MFPEIGSALWDDDWHFSLDGLRCFALGFATRLKRHLLLIGAFKEGLCLYIVADSTIDYCNWFDGTRHGQGEWTGDANDILTEAFGSVGLRVHLDVAGGTGFCVSSRFGNTVPALMKAYRECHVGNELSSAFDGVVILGGYNDIHKRWSANCFRDAVQDTIQESLSLLQADSFSGAGDVSDPVLVSASAGGSTDSPAPEQRQWGYVPMERGEYGASAGHLKRRCFLR